MMNWLGRLENVELLWIHREADELFQRDLSELGLKHIAGGK